jgi:hypothetical protein
MSEATNGRVHHLQGGYGLHGFEVEEQQWFIIYRRVLKSKLFEFFHGYRKCFKSFKFNNV